MMPHQRRVLLVEDSRSDAAELQESLKGAGLLAFTFTHVQTWAEAVERLRDEPFDILLLDLSLPDVTGREAFLRARAAAPALPIVLLTGLEDQAASLGALREGVQDYLIKGHMDGRQVAQALRFAIERKQAQAELQRARDELDFRVQQRTAELKQSVGILKTEIEYRQQVEQALRESEQRYRTLFEAAPVGIGISNSEGRVLAFNHRLCEMAHLSPEEARTTPASAFYVDPTQRRRLLDQLQRTGRVDEAETLFRGKDGSLLLCLVHMEEIQLGQEKVLMTIVQDITRQKQTERRLEGVAALLKLFANRPSRKEYLEEVVRLLRDWCGCSSGGVRLLDQHGRIPYAAHTGFNRQFLQQESALSLTRSDCACIRVLQGNLRREDQRCRSADGSFFCNCTTRLIGQAKQSVVKCASTACLNAGYESIAHTAVRYGNELLGTIHLADRRAGRFPVETIQFIESVAPLVGEAIHQFSIEEALRESEARFRSMFERHTAAMLLREPDSGALVDANPAAAAFYGYSREHLRTMNLADLNTLPRKTIDAYRRRALGHHAPLVFPHRLASGQIRTVEVYSSPVTVQGRKLLFSIIHDITERKLLEKQVLEISEQERARVGRDLHDSLGGKLSGAALIGKTLARRLAARSWPEASLANEVVRAINESITDTRSIARGLCPVELSVGGLAGGLAELAADTQRRSGISCRFQHDERVHIPDRYVALNLFQIAREAVANAVRHGRPRHVTIRLGRTADEICLEVRHDGKGLPPDLHQTKGLGLGTMKYRAGAIGGHFAIESSTNGMVVTCTLPVAALGDT
ncbi:MAG TPA: PAS domain S-box protein, partial [Dongiaceae bacterium]|nr:PAS domain S-box protein [Dongiaceae bacterium]